MERLPPTRGYSEENHQFLHPSYFPYSPEHYGFYPNPYALYQYEQMSSDLQWPPPSFYQTNEYMLPHSSLLGPGYMPPVGLSPYIRMPPGRGNSLLRMRAFKKSRGFQHSVGNPRFMAPAGPRFSYQQALQNQPGCSAGGAEEWRQGARPVFSSRPLNPYAAPYQSKRCILPESTRSSTAKDILSEAMKESGIAEMEVSVPSQNVVTDTPAVKKESTAEVQGCGPGEAVNKYGSDLLDNIFSTSNEDIGSVLFFPELEDHDNMKGISSDRCATKSFQSNSHSATPFFGNSILKESSRNSSRQAPRSKKKCQLGKTSASSGEHPSSVTSQNQGCQLVKIPPAGSGGNSFTISESRSYGLNLSQTTSQKCNFFDALNYGNSDCSPAQMKDLSSTPIKDSSNLPSADLLDMPTLEDLALQLTNNEDSTINNINIDCLIHNVNEFCQLDKDDDPAGSLFSFDDKGEILFNLPEDPVPVKHEYAAKQPYIQEKFAKDTKRHCETSSDTKSEKSPLESVSHSAKPEASKENLNVTSAHQTTSKQTFVSRKDRSRQEGLSVKFAPRVCNESNTDTSLPHGAHSEAGRRGPVSSLLQTGHRKSGKPAIDPNTVSYICNPETWVRQASSETKLTTEIANRNGSADPSKTEKLQNRVKKAEQKKFPSDKFSCRLPEFSPREYLTRSKTQTCDTNKEGDVAASFLTASTKNNPGSSGESEATRFLGAFIRNFENFREEEEMVAVDPKEVFQCGPIKDDDSLRIGKDSFHASVVEMASLCDASENTIKVASESLLKENRVSENLTTVELIQDVGSVEVLPNALALSISREEYEHILYDEENVLENACKLSRTFDKEPGQMAFVG